jgi:hypothetical protein
MLLAAKLKSGKGSRRSAAGERSAARLERLAVSATIAGDVDRESNADVAVGFQIWVLALGIECPSGMPFQGPDNSHAGKQHGSAVFSGIDEHLDRQPPFLSITFRLRKLPDVVGGVSQGLRRRSLRERERLSERTIPGHAKLPYRQMAPNAAE